MTINQIFNNLKSKEMQSEYFFLVTTFKDTYKDNILGIYSNGEVIAYSEVTETRDLLTQEDIAYILAQERVNPERFIQYSI